MHNFKTAALVATMTMALAGTASAGSATGGATGTSAAGAGALSFSATGAASYGKGAANGTTSIRNESGAAQLSGARSTLSFTTTDGTVKQAGSVVKKGIRTTTNITDRVDGIDVIQTNEAFVDGYDFSKTTIRDKGSNTAGIGGGVAGRVGGGWATGGYEITGRKGW